MNRWSLLGGVVALVVLFAAPATALGEEHAVDPQSTPAQIADTWALSDGAAAQGGQDQVWIWGPAIRSTTVEPYQESPGDVRQVFYFDKARMEITDPNADQSTPWYVTSGLLVRNMIAGWVQTGDSAVIETEPANVPLTGDLIDNPRSPTFASIAPLSSIGSQIESNRSAERVGQPVTALLSADGTVAEGVVTNRSVTIDFYDGTLGHNLPNVFHDWLDAQPVTWAYLTGFPITEPYWVDTIVAGQPKLVLVQAFERRLLTYTPDNPEGWQVELGNAGLQFRDWRGLVAPTDQNLLPLASGLPYGELIIATAQEYGLDPYFFAALAKVSSGFDPQAQRDNGAQGFFGVPNDLLATETYPLDPKVNAELAAREITRLSESHDDWRAVLANYYDRDTELDWSDPALNAFVSGVLDTQAQLAIEFAPQPKTSSEDDPTNEADLRWVGSGHAAYYSAGYTTAWWDATIAKHAGWGNAVPGWAPDPNGYYCVHPDFKPGQRLQLTANGVTLWCTIGDSVNPAHVAQWRTRWAVELSWPTFTALHLDRNNQVEVRAP